MNISEFSVKRPVTIVMIILSLVALGLISYSKIPLMSMPDMSFPQLTVRVPYPSSSPDEVERLITRPLEDALGTIGHLKTLSSTSSGSQSSVRVEFESGTDMDLAGMEIRDRIDQVRGDFPVDVDRIRIWQFNPEDFPIIRFSVSWSGDPADFYDVVTKVIQPRLQRVDGVAEVELDGMTEKQMLVHVDNEALQTHNLDLFNVSQLLSQNNITLAAGSVLEGGRKYSVRAVGEFQTADEIINLPIPGTSLNLSDVADVRFDYPEENRFRRLNGMDAVTLQIKKASNAHVVETAKRVKAVMAEIQAQPQFSALEVRTNRDQSGDILKQLGDLRNSGLLGGFLAAVILFLFLRNFRSTLIISLAIPVSIIVTFTFIYLLRTGFDSEVTINVMSLMGLMLAVGMLVDSAVVILESIYRHRQENNLSGTMAAIVGSREVGVALIASTATTLCVFIPIIFLDGGGNRMLQFFKDFAVAFSVVMVAALFIALTLIPMLAARLFNKPLGAPSKTVQRVIHLYGRVLGWNLHHRFATVLIFGGIIFGSYWCYNNIERAYVPQMISRDVSIAATVPKEYGIEDVKLLFGQVEQILLTKKDELRIESLQTSGGLRRANIQVVLTPPETRTESTKQLQEKIKAELPEIAGVQWKAGRMRHYGGGDNTGVSVELRGDNMDVLATLAEDIRLRIETIPGVRDVDTSLERGAEEIQVSVNRAQSQAYGISPQQAARTVQAALSNRARGKFKTEDREVDILLQLEEEDRANVSQLKNMTFERPEGMIAFGNLADFNMTRGPEAIKREDRESIVTVFGNTQGSGMMEVRGQVGQIMSQVDLPAGYSWKMGRNFRMMSESEDSSMFAVVMALALIYIIMAALLESFVHPFTIMLSSIPTAFIGVGIVFYVTNTNLDMSAWLGLMVLAGLVVNNAIVLIDHINQLRREGFSQHDAIIQGGKHRFRPILMTALTTIFGLFPLVAPGIWPEYFGPIEDRGAAMYLPVSMALVAGLTTSGILTLVMLPTIYSFMDDLTMWAKRLVRSV
ncbi:MAG: efflux RND transporter permease subunit [Gemmatimonadota bacterium]|nr:efflux RND transporter permease subunit [Gemmatimonadota bacterium]